MSLCYGQLAIAHLLKGDKDQSKDKFRECMKIAESLNAVQMQLECRLCLAYIAFDASQWNDAKMHFDEAYKVSQFISLICFLQVAKGSGDKKIAEQCLCNAGIALGNGMMEQEQKLTSTFYNRQDQQDGSNHDEDEEVKGEDLVATAEVPDYQMNAIGQATFYGGGFGNINQNDWSDEEDDDENEAEDLEVEELR